MTMYEHCMSIAAATTAKWEIHKMREKREIFSWSSSSSRRVTHAQLSRAVNRFLDRRFKPRVCTRGKLDKNSLPSIHPFLSPIHISSIIMWGSERSRWGCPRWWIQGIPVPHPSPTLPPNRCLHTYTNPGVDTKNQKIVHMGKKGEVVNITHGGYDKHQYYESYLIHRSMFKSSNITGYKLFRFLSVGCVISIRTFGLIKLEFV